jgi:hypothetical protein
MGVLEVEIMFIAPDEVNLKLVDGCTGTILLLAGEFKNGAAKFDYSALSAIYLHSCQMGESTFCICLIEISVQMFGKLPLHFFSCLSISTPGLGLCHLCYRLPLL